MDLDLSGSKVPKPVWPRQQGPDSLGSDRPSVADRMLCDRQLGWHVTSRRLQGQRPKWADARRLGVQKGNPRMGSARARSRLMV